MEDLRSDSTRLLDALINARMQPPIKFEGKLTTLFSQTLRENNWKVMAAVRGHELIALLPPDQLLLGLAIDVGTTKLAAYLVDLSSGQTLAKAGAMNPQIGYGEDVISRILTQITIRMVGKHCR